MKLITTTRVTVNSSITLSPEVKELLNIKQGDIIAIHEDEGNVVLKKASLVVEG
ncbi:MAG: hypothetical protein PHU34_12135 [Candidatus Methanoperedens sp.]|nr:hypothetical protein [Candidatus Methanoperedens sp.]